MHSIVGFGVAINLLPDHGNIIAAFVPEKPLCCLVKIKANFAYVIYNISNLLYFFAKIIDMKTTFMAFLRSKARGNTVWSVEPKKDKRKTTIEKF